MDVSCFQFTCRLLGVILEETSPEELQVGCNGVALMPKLTSVYIIDLL